MYDIQLVRPATFSRSELATGNLNISAITLTVPCRHAEAKIQTKARHNNKPLYRRSLSKVNFASYIPIAILAARNIIRDAVEDAVRKGDLQIASLLVMANGLATIHCPVNNNRKNKRTLGVLTNISRMNRYGY
jgi:hypothetical protein